MSHATRKRGNVGTGGEPAFPPVLPRRRAAFSLETPVGADEESALGDLVPDRAAESPFEVGSRHLRREGVLRALEALPPRDRRVISMRFGLAGDERCTFEEIAEEFDVTRERIRQIELHALKRLKRLPEVRQPHDAG